MVRIDTLLLYSLSDSWSFGSGRESGFPQVDTATWVKKELRDDTSGRSPDAGDCVSSSLMEEMPSCNNMGHQNANAFSAQAPFPAPSNPSSNAETPKGKVRVSFSERQMHTLVQRFSVQRYLTPAEMKNLAELTGLTYKQVGGLCWNLLGGGGGWRWVGGHLETIPPESCLSFWLVGEDLVSKSKDEAEETPEGQQLGVRTLQRHQESQPSHPP